MNQLLEILERGLSIEQATILTKLNGCVLTSPLKIEDKLILGEFLKDLEEFLRGEVD